MILWKSNILRGQGNSLRRRLVVRARWPHCCNLVATMAQARANLARASERAQAQLPLFFAPMDHFFLGRRQSNPIALSIKPWMEMS